MDPERRATPARQPGPQRAGELLGAVLQAVQRKSSRAKVSSAFEAVVDEQVARSCEVVGFRNGTLHVEVASAPLYAELTAFHAETIRLSMNERLDSPKIARVVFRLNGTTHA